MYDLVIAEKPSVAQSIARVLGCTGRQDGYLEGGGYLVSWCIGHLVELSEPESYDGKYEIWKKEDLPIIPERWSYEVTASVKKQFGILKDLMHRDDVSCVINACDAGREGELIFRLVYEKASCRKHMKRLWISSMEDEAVINGFKNLKDGSEYDLLYKAALCRERADWIVGINATRLFSTLYGQTLNVGRVMTPTLALTVDREAQIRDFKQEDTFTVILRTDIGDLASKKFKNREEAKDLLAKCMIMGKVKITKSEKKEKQEKAPALYDLTTLQREANKKLGFTAQQTLDYTQSLYEKKLVSYPRTDSRYLTDDMEQILPQLIEKAGKISGAKPTDTQNHRAVINSKKVTDHHAIIPTASADKTDPGSLTAGEKEILRLIAVRLVEAVSCPCIYEEVLVEGECAGERFTAKGKAVIDIGWKGVAGTGENTNEKKTGTDDDGLILSADHNAGDEIKITQAGVKAGKTQPPKSYTEDTLLAAMEKAGSDETPDEAERKGLGTPATRASIIEKLVRTGFIERQGEKKTKYLVPTHKGEALIAVIPEIIRSASMTAEWEEKLLEIEKEAYDAEQFMNGIEKMVKDLVDTYEVVKNAAVMMRPKAETVGKCPCCGRSVVEKSAGFFCESNDCKFALWKDNRFFGSLSKKITKPVAEQLLTKRKAKLKGCRSAKTGKAYDCTVTMNVDETGRVQFGLEFEKKHSIER